MDLRSGSPIAKFRACSANTLIDVSKLMVIALPGFVGLTRTRRLETTLVTDRSTGSRPFSNRAFKLSDDPLTNEESRTSGAIVSIHRTMRPTTPGFPPRLGWIYVQGSHQPPH